MNEKLNSEKGNVIQLADVRRQKGQEQKVAPADSISFPRKEIHITPEAAFRVAEDVIRQYTHGNFLAPAFMKSYADKERAENEMGLVLTRREGTVEDRAQKALERHRHSVKGFTVENLQNALALHNENQRHYAAPMILAIAEEVFLRSWRA